MTTFIEHRDDVARLADTDDQKIGVDVVTRVLSVHAKLLAEKSLVDGAELFTELLRVGEANLGGVADDPTPSKDKDKPGKPSKSGKDKKGKSKKK